MERLYLKSILFLILCLFSFNELEAKTLFGKTVREKELRVDLSGSYFYKTASFGVEGNVESMQPDEEFSMIDSELFIQYGFAPSFEMFGGGRFRMVDSIESDVRQKNTNIESYHIGGKFHLTEAMGFLIAIEGDVRNTAYTNNIFDSNTTPDNNIILGDDGLWIKGGAMFTKVFVSGHMIEGSIHYQLPPDHLSDEFLYDLHYLFKGSMVTFLLGVDGIISLNNDPHGDNVQNRPRMSTGVTDLFNSINRSWLRPKVELGFWGESWGGRIFSSRIFSGTSTDEGWLVGLGLTWIGKGIDSTNSLDRDFKEYRDSATISKISPRSNFLKINKGVSSDIERGMAVDIYQSDFFGGNILIASGVVFSVESDSAVIKVNKIHRKIPIKKGFIVRIK